MTRPLVIYIPGLKPKPDPESHAEALFRCLKTGVNRIDPVVADQIAEPGGFELVSWTYDFYGEHRDIELDRDDIDAVISKREASEHDIIVATSLRRRFAIWFFSLVDYLPFVVPSLATEEIEVHIRDYFRYVRDNHGKGESARRSLKASLSRASDQGRPVLLLSHSMGSVIAFDALWQLSMAGGAGVDLLLTTGSPLGQNTVQRHLLGKGEQGERRYPSNIRTWINIAAIGELTATDRRLKGDFGAMVKLGLVEDIVDHEVFNYYHMHGNLNVHAEYGYLVNEVTARCVVDWWKGASV